MYRRALIVLSCLLSYPAAYAAGPSTIAKVNRHLWQEPVNTLASFDKASRASILVYVQSLYDMQKLSDSDMKTAFKIKNVNRDSVDKWSAKELDLSLRNYQAAAKNCSSADWSCLENIPSVPEFLKKAQQALAQKPSALSEWALDLGQFSRAYVSEQLRLAALFPTVSSEIATFNDQEWNGDELADREFLLTFDDGPTQPQGETDHVTAMLNTLHKNAIFFVLGENYQKRLNQTDPQSLNELYKGQCVAIHGWEHQSHAKWSEWQSSITRTKSLLISTLSPQPNDNSGKFVPLFRPPYGQRKADSQDFFVKQGLKITLWNLDSQDWNSQVSSEDVVNRMKSLMLIKRHGVLLFHDVHTKAKTALPLLLNELNGSVTWQDCHQFHS